MIKSLCLHTPAGVSGFSRSKDMSTDLGWSIHLFQLLEPDAGLATTQKLLQRVEEEGVGIALLLLRIMPSGKYQRHKLTPVGPQSFL